MAYSKKKTIEEIQVPANIIYLNQDNFMNELPYKSIFDKGKVGGGGTTVALENEHDYIIAVPYISLIENKITQNKANTNPHKNIYYGAYGTLSNEEILKYHKSVHPRKYLVTYNSVSKLIGIIGGVKGFKLLVDEYHLLFSHYAFRNPVIVNILKVFKEFDDYCFMSATPISEEFVLEELNSLRLVKAVWEKQNKTEVISVYCDDIFSTVRDIVNKHVRNEIKGNAYIFLNSINFIIDVIRENELDVEHTRVICSKNNPKIKYDVIKEFISDILSSPKKINFLTSAYFEGCDIYDEDGMVYVVSDPSLEHTLTDISTSFYQISGRIRNNEKYRNQIVHLYSRTKNSGLSFEEYRAECDLEIEKATHIINQFNENLDYFARNAIVSISADEKYITRDGEGIFKFNINMYNLDLYEKKLTMSLYRNPEKLSEEYLLKGFTVKHLHSNVELSLKNIRTKDKTTLSEAVEYIESTNFYYGRSGKKYKGGYTYVPEYNFNGLDYSEVEKIINDYFKKWPFLEDAICYLGFDGIKKEKFIITNIKSKIVNEKYESDLPKIAKLLEIEIGSRKEFTNLELKTILQKVYKDADFWNVTAKASDINKFYNSKIMDIDEGKGYRIVSKKLFYE